MWLKLKSHQPHDSLAAVFGLACACGCNQSRASLGLPGKGGGGLGPCIGLSGLLWRRLQRLLSFSWYDSAKLHLVLRRYPGFGPSLGFGAGRCPGRFCLARGCVAGLCLRPCQSVLLVLSRAGVDSAVARAGVFCPGRCLCCLPWAPPTDSIFVRCTYPAERCDGCARGATSHLLWSGAALLWSCQAAAPATPPPLLRCLSSFLYR